MIDVLNSEDILCFEKVSFALGKMGEPAIDPLIAILKDRNSWSQNYAIEAVGKTKDERTDQSKMQDKDYLLVGRASAAISALRDILGEIKDKRALEPLIIALKDKSSYIRGGAARVLADIDDNRAVEPLINVLKDEDSDVRYNAAVALHFITEQDFGEDLAKWQQWREKQ